MFIYNRMAAAVYATAWAYARNPLWADDSAPIGHGDCTNFVSQALFASGWVMRYPSYKYTCDWFSKMFDYTRRDRSRSWASANRFEGFLKGSGRARPCLLPEILIGDVLQEYLPGSDYPSHTMMVTKVSRGRIYLSYHSTDHMNILLDDVLTKSSAYVNFTFWKILDVYGS